MSQPQLVAVARSKTKEISLLEGKLWLSRRNYWRQSRRLRSVRGRLEQNVLRGDVRALVVNINSIIRSGKENKKKALIPFICDIAKSAAMRDDDTGHGNRGMHWKETSKKVFAVVQKKGHQSLVRFFKETADSPSEETIRRQWGKDLVTLMMGEHQENFTAVGKIYEGMMALLGIAGPVPYEVEEDATHINGRYAYSQRDDSPVGTCGGLSASHQCDANHNHAPLGSGTDAYLRIVRFALEEKRAFHLRVVVIVPLHPKLPALPVVVHPTCLAFGTGWVQRSWQRMDGFCEEAFAGSLGPVPQGNGSDGSAPHFAAMKISMNIKPGDGRFSLNAPGLLVTGSIKVVGGKLYVAGLHMQDPRHDIGLLFGNGLDNNTKDFMMGKYPASISDYRVTARLAEQNGDSHGCIKRHLDRTDKQNKATSSVMTARLMLACMEKAVNGGYGAKQPFEGSLAFGRLLSRFLLIFFGKKQSHADRAKHAGFFTGLLRRARWHVKATKGLTLSANFVPAQTYGHAIQSAQVAILKLKAQREFHGHLPAHIENSGSNAVEKMFSQSGGYGASSSNQRDYNADEGRKRFETVLLLNKYAAEDNGLNFGEEDRATQRDIKIHLHEDEAAEDADAGAHCDDATLISNWVAGDEEAKAAAKELGMEPAHGTSWWLEPWLEEESHMAEMKQEDAADWQASGQSSSSGGSGGSDEPNEDGGGEPNENGGGNGDDLTGGIDEEEGSELVQSLAHAASLASSAPAQSRGRARSVTSR